jgi:rare lipoprotein A
MTPRPIRTPAFLLAVLLALCGGAVQAEQGAGLEGRAQAASAAPADEAEGERAALLSRALAAVKSAIPRKPAEPETPAAAAVPHQQGVASFYGRLFHQRKTASGERFDMRDLTAAHPSLPFGTRVCVQSQVNGRQVAVRINDRGPHVRGRIIDLSQGAAEALDMLGRGTKQVVLRVLGREEACS